MDACPLFRRSTSHTSGRNGDYHPNHRCPDASTQMPGDHHKVSANASSTNPARLLAIFVVDTTQQELVIPDK